MSKCGVSPKRGEIVDFSPKAGYVWPAIILAVTPREGPWLVSLQAFTKNGTSYYEDVPFEPIDEVYPSAGREWCPKDKQEDKLGEDLPEPADGAPVLT